MIFSAGMGGGLMFWGVAFATRSQLAILGGIAVISLLCSLTPLESGVRYISGAK